ncbi:hypothetical protein TWF481_001116 [Arthrobotrys musiformis]|uniref:Uncharacterized protein n=1 Tax=Arthrobotrys musiformis TaxID=47236 RepID=A0AAV9WRV7_9PEZI
MSRAHPAPDSGPMRELILMQAIINAYNAPLKFDVAAQALGITIKAVSGRYNRLKKKVETAGILHPLSYDLGEDGKPIKRGRGRPPKRANLPVPSKAVPTVVMSNCDDDEDDEDPEMAVANSAAGSSQGAKLVKVEYPSSDGEDSMDG